MASPNTVERVDLSIFYDGPALADHRMNVRDLAPALLGLADLMQSANQTLRPGQPPVSLDITATSEGSFIAELAVIHRQVVDLLTSSDSAALGSLIGYVTGVSGLIAYVKARRRGATEDVLPNGYVRITQPDGTTLEFPPEVLALYRQQTARTALQAVVAPLAQDGITLFEVRPAPTAPPTVRVTEDELDSISQALTNDAETLITDQHYEQTLTLMSPSFSGNKWRLNDGISTRYMSVEDSDFIRQVDQGRVAFRSHDRLRAEVWLRQWEDSGGVIHTEHVITKVIRHVPYVPPFELGNDGIGI